MSWRVANSLDKLRSQVNAAWPKRNKSSDGTIGDAAHASRSSDHNPWVKDGKTGVVTGMDITNDPARGPVSNDLAEALRASRDPRIKYIISNARICSGDAGPSPWAWRPYSGTNAHRKHVHLSVKPEKALYDSVRPWKIGGRIAEPVAKVHIPEAEQDDPAPLNVQPVTAPKRIDVETIQKRLDSIGYHEVGGIDGVWGGKTAAAIAAFKNDRGIAGEPVIDKVLIDALDTLPSGWTRPIAPERASITAHDLAPKVESVRQTLWQRFWAKVTGVGALIAAAFNGASEYFESVKEYVRPVMDFFTDVPGWLWLIGIGGAALLLYLSANKAANATVDDKRSGRLN
ncbi:MAG: peptidoglycan-binding domain-containing protein [Hyphomicrobium sp.]|jgi:hypothetical protein